MPSMWAALPVARHTGEPLPASVLGGRYPRFWTLRGCQAYCTKRSEHATLYRWEPSLVSVRGIMTEIPPQGVTNLTYRVHWVYGYLRAKTINWLPNL